MSAKPAIIPPEELRPAAELAGKILEQMDRILLGRADLHRLVLIGILSQGHILLEGLPGLGKTALVKTLGQILKLDFKRIQFTPDLMPGDVLGAHILQDNPSGSRDMVFHPGPVFTNLLLADEINRASPKTQSSLLETMQEHTVTLLGTTRKLPFPFFVLASQNPIELEGTYPLPEAQLDRFLFRVLFNSVPAEVLEAIISQRRRGELPAPTWQLDSEQLKSLFGVMDRIFLPGPVARYAFGRRDPRGRNRGPRPRKPLRDLRRLAPRGDRHCRSRPRASSPGGPAFRGFRGRQTRCPAGPESSAHFELPSPF